MLISGSEPERQRSGGTFSRDKNASRLLFFCLFRFDQSIHLAGLVLVGTFFSLSIKVTNTMCLAPAQNSSEDHPTIPLTLASIVTPPSAPTGKTTLTRTSVPSKWLLLQEANLSRLVGASASVNLPPEQLLASGMPAPAPEFQYRC